MPVRQDEKKPSVVAHEFGVGKAAAQMGAHDGADVAHVASDEDSHCQTIHGVSPRSTIPSSSILSLKVSAHSQKPS